MNDNSIILMQVTLELNLERDGVTHSTPQIIQGTMGAPEGFKHPRPKLEFDNQIWQFDNQKLSCTEKGEMSNFNNCLNVESVTKLW